METARAARARAEAEAAESAAAQWKAQAGCLRCFPLHPALPLAYHPHLAPPVQVANEWKAVAEKEAAVANAAVATARREAEAMMPAKAAAPPTLFGRPAPPGPPGKRIPIWRSNPRLVDSVHLLLTRSGPTTGQPDPLQSPPARRCPRGGERSRTAAE